MMCYLVGVCSGCTYFTYKHECNSSEDSLSEDDDDDPGIQYVAPVETNLVKDIFKRLKTSTRATLIAIGGSLIMS